MKKASWPLMFLFVIGIGSGSFSLLAKPIDVATFVRFQQSAAGQSVNMDPALQWQYLEDPIQVPAFRTANAPSPADWKPLLSIPSRGDIFKPTEKTIQSAFDRILANMEIGRTALSPKEKDALKAARKLLYDPPDGSKETPAYSHYRALIKDLAEAKAKSQDNATSEAERSSILLKVQELNEQLIADTSLKSIAAAESLVNRLSPPTSNDVVAVVKDSVDRKIASSWTDFLERLADPAGWTSYSSSNLGIVNGNAMLSARLSNTWQPLSDGKVRSLISPRIVAWQFSLKPISTTWSDVPMDLAQRKNWRLKDSSKVASGTLEDAGTNAVLPQSVAKIWVLRDVSIWFEQESGEEILSALEKGQGIRIGNLAVNGGSAYYTPTSLHIPQPAIVAVTIQAYPEMPTPNANIEW